MCAKRKVLSESEKIIYTLDKLQATAKDDRRKAELNNIKERLLLKMGKVVSEDTDTSN